MHAKSIETWTSNPNPPESSLSSLVKENCNSLSHKLNKSKQQQCVLEQEALMVRGGYSGGGTGIPVFGMKILLQLCLTSLNVACWLIPLKIPKFTNSKVAVSVANAFSGGVFLSLAFGHLLPEAVEAFHGRNVPETLPYFLALTGYMMIFFVEKIAFDAHSLMGHDHGHHGHAHSHDHSHAPGTPESGVVHLQAPSNKVMKGGAEVTAVTDASTSGRSSLVLLLALSVHSMFETMAMGLCDTTLEATLLAVSIGLHQPAESIALLVSFLKSGMPRRKVIGYLSLFSSIGALGFGIGMVVNEFAGKIVDAVLVALAAGTFIYVGATEVIAEEFEEKENKWKKFGALMTGIGLIAAVTSYTEGFHDHSHGHSHDFGHDHSNSHNH